MTPLLLTDIERAVRSSWGADTSPPEFRSRWRPDNPARGQCGVTAMVLNDLLVTGGTVIPRPPMTEWRRLREEYELLRSRVLEKLNSLPPMANDSSRLVS